MINLIRFAAIAVYASGAIFTFGLVYNRTQCMDVQTPSCPEYKSATGMMGAIFWPLAISAIMQEGGAA